MSMINDRYALFYNRRSGGMADVYQAIDMQKGPQEVVAIKIFKNQEIEAEVLAESFKRETQALKELKHLTLSNSSIQVRMKARVTISSSWSGWRRT